MTKNSSPNVAEHAVYYITETKQHESLDPLDGDKTSNLPIQRMLYLTPLEVGPDDRLVSQILSQFSFDRNSNQINLQVSEGRAFSDGTPISAEDVVTTITRMLRARPGFPVLRSIAGKTQWIKDGANLDKLPSGVTLDGNTIQIQLTQFEHNPLYRFCLELFSIIPKKCIDSKSSKIVCGEIPTSGYYTIDSQSENSLTFKKREQGKIYGLTTPLSIEFRYDDIDGLGTSYNLNKNEVIATNEAKLTGEELDRISEKYNVIKKPSSRFSVLLINKRSSKFSDNQFRFWLAQKFRQAYRDSSDLTEKEASIFTKILPGYLTSESLSKNSPPSGTPGKTNLNQLAKLRWVENPYIGKNLLRQPLELIFSELGLKLPNPLTFKSRTEFEEAFVNGEIDLMYGSTGFWSLDPVGDIQMLFTPNMHETLEGVWSDPAIQNLLSDLTISDGDISAFERVNQYIYNQAYFNVFGHHARIYIQADRKINGLLPFGITSPPPWMLFAR